MKMVVLNGVKIKIGSQIRFVNDKNLYTGIKGVIKPKLGQVYTVRDINEIDGFLLKEIKNIDFEWYSESGQLDFIAEPGFAKWRFEPANPLKSDKVVQIEILPEIKETVYIPRKRKVKID